MADSYWHKIQRHWALLGKPQRPCPEVVAAVKSYIGAAAGKTLLLGVTPELADIGTDVTAIDRNESMVNYIWPGDTGARRAHVGDWRNLELEVGSFDACVADGSLNAVQFGDIGLVFKGVANAVKPGGRCAFRLFATPEKCESLKEVQELVWDGKVKGFHALKWYIAMAIVAARGKPDIHVPEILEQFNALFPDRKALAQRLGWADDVIATIDAYSSSNDIYCFPTARQFLSLVPKEFSNPGIVTSGSYELAERCPLLVMERAA